MRAKYESDKKDQELEKSKLAQKYQIIMFSLSTLLILAMGLVLYSRHKTLKNKNLQIVRQNNELLNLNATKDKFFSILAHDLKNPIYSIKNMLEIVSMEFDSFDEEELVDYTPHAS